MPKVTVEGIEVNFRTPVNPERALGQNVLYVHGTGCDARVWDRHMEVVSRAHTPIAVDLPGHGESSGGGFRGVADYAYFAVALAEALGWKKFVMAGHSLGGGIIQAAALYAPENVKAMILVDTGARLRVAPQIMEYARACAEGKNPPILNPRIGFSLTTDQEILDQVKIITDDAEPTVTFKDWIADDSCDFLSRVSEFSLPSLAIVGEDDELTPVRYAEFFSKNMSNCKISIIKRAGHWTFYEQPDEFDRAVISFLQGLSD